MMKNRITSQTPAGHCRLASEEKPLLKEPGDFVTIEGIPFPAALLAESRRQQLLQFTEFRLEVRRKPGVGSNV